MKHAAAYLRNGKVFMCPVSRTTKGSMIDCEPIVVADENDAELGTKVLDALSRSLVGVPHPESWEGPSPLEKAAGVRSYEAFAKFAKSVGITRNPEGVVFTPSKNGGRGKRFLHLKKRIRCQSIEAEVADALKAAFDACE